MPTCHTCKTSEEIKRGLFADTPWGEVPCSTCRHFDKCNSTDAQEMLTEIAEIKAEAAPVVLPVSLMQAFVAGILSLPPHLRDVVSYRYQGYSYKRIAEIQHISIKAASKRLAKAFELWPELRTLQLNRYTQRTGQRGNQ